nr:MAG TPA: hypothetical protein [Caudoviricetes sp.]
MLFLVPRTKCPKKMHKFYGQNVLVIIYKIKRIYILG